MGPACTPPPTGRGGRSANGTGNVHHAHAVIARCQRVEDLPSATSRPTPAAEPAVQRDVEEEHVHSRLAEEAELAPLGVPLHERARPPRGSTRSATRATCKLAFAGEMCGSRPDADAVTMSADLTFHGAVFLHGPVHGARDQRVGELAISGPLFVPADAARRIPLPPPTGASGSTTAAEGLPDDRTANDWPLPRPATVCLTREQH